MSANPDFKDLFKLFNDAGVEYLVVGAHAVVYYSEPRYTKDLDIWINPTPANAKRVFHALQSFGAPLKDMTPAKFTEQDLIYQIGVAPNRIDIIMSIAGVQFTAAWAKRAGSTYDGIPIPILGKASLMRTKQATGRPQDLLDLEKLKASEHDPGNA